MRINADSTRTFLYSAVALVIFTIGAFALIGWDQYETDNHNHRNMQEKK